ncbi:MAG: hypothetical protein ACR2IF_03500 [Terriglobales bacterium]
MRWFWMRGKEFSAILGSLLLCIAMSASAQMPAAKTPPHAPAPMAKQPAPAQSAPAQTTAAQPGQRVVVVEPNRVFDPFLDYPYPYAYEPDYMAQNFGYVKIDAKDVKDKDASVYVDGGFADKLGKAKKFALRPGTHNIELRDSDGREIFRERVAVLVSKTTTLHVG